MSITSICKKALLKAVLIATPIASLTGAVGIRPENENLKSAQKIGQEIAEAIHDARQNKSNMQANLDAIPVRPASNVMR